MISQNGWPVFADTRKFTRFNQAGRGWWAANDDVATCASEFIRRFNAEVERIAIPGDVLDDWSWAFRPIRGQTTGFTNHASATAWDLNATKHPRGQRNTFTVKQRDALRKIRNEITDLAGRPVFRLGMDYEHAPEDDMHFEVNATATQMQQAAIKLRTRDEESDGMANITPAQFAQLVGDAEITLTEAAARAMSTKDVPRKKGDRVSLSYLWQWGGASQFREATDIAEIKSQLAGLSASVIAVETQVKAVAAALAAALAKTPTV